MNELLGSIGQAPVNTLAGPGVVGDVLTALNYLRTRSRAVQLQGWAFNTDEAYTISPNDEGLLLVPDGILKIKAAPGLQQRRHPSGVMAMWDSPNQTWTHAAPVDFSVVWGFPFDDLPQVARHYVTVVAGRDFQRNTIGSTNLDGFKQQDERVAWVQMQREERANRQTNAFTANASMAAATSRRTY